MHHKLHDIWPCIVTTHVATRLGHQHGFEGPTRGHDRVEPSGPCAASAPSMVGPLLTTLHTMCSADCHRLSLTSARTRTSRKPARLTSTRITRNARGEPPGASGASTRSALLAC
jgi:hypothetical protein